MVIKNTSPEGAKGYICYVLLPITSNKFLIYDLQCNKVQGTRYNFRFKSYIVPCKSYILLFLVLIKKNFSEETCPAHVKHSFLSPLRGWFYFEIINYEC